MGVPSTEEAANTVYRLPIPANDELRESQIMDVETPENGASRILVLDRHEAICPAGWQDRGGVVDVDTSPIAPSMRSDLYRASRG